MQESDVLCEPATLRNLELGGRDFKVRDPDDDSDDDDDDADDMDEMEQPGKYYSRRKSHHSLITRGVLLTDCL